MGKQEQILDIVRLKGPVLPVHVARETKLSMLFAGAYLAELTSSKKVLISKIKVGASPLYYIQGQEAKLQNFSKHLGNKEQEALNNLREGKILNDENLEPVIRVALRNIPDFAIPVKVNLKSGSELYWKWYLIPNNEAEVMIRELINKKLEEEKAIEIEKEEEIKKEESKLKEIEVEQKDEKNNKVEKENKKKIKSKPKKKAKPRKKKKTIQKELIETKVEPEPVNIEVKDSLLEKVQTNFDAKGILITNCEVIIEGKELDLLIKIPTVVGDLTYFCKAKKKARNTENDLFATILAAQQKGLPGLFVATGTMNKKGKEILESKSKTIQFLSIK